jgi:hypothetical protein
MIKIDFPAPAFKIKKQDEKEFIFDELRKQWIKLTPEEWVRQNFIQYLIQVKKYPAALIGIEKEIKLGELKKRFDLLVYNKEHEPWMMIECKAMSVDLKEDVLQQLLRYHISIPVNYLVITNGSYTVCYRKKEGQLEMVSELPFIKTG